MHINSVNRGDMWTIEMTIVVVCRLIGRPLMSMGCPLCRGVMGLSRKMMMPRFISN